jgi:hypothetical protein
MKSKEVGMCYASVGNQSRDAKEDEILVVKRQPYGSNWLVSPDDASTAVCLRGGTEVELLYIPEVIQQGIRMPGEAKATFKTEDCWERDVFVFDNRRTVSLQKLPTGQVVRVLSIPSGLSHREDSVQRDRSEVEIFSI